MLKNYLTTSIRNLSRYKGYSLINIFGLTIGLATCIFIFLWITDELSYDQFHGNKDRLYRILAKWHYTDKNETGWSTPVKLAEALHADIPEVEYTIRMDWGNDQLFKYKEKALPASGNYADAELFKAFTFPIIKGNPALLLPDDNSVAISRHMAANFFPTEDALGKVFHMQDGNDLKVTAVFEDLPKNSTLHFDYIQPFTVWIKENKDNSEAWGNNVMQTYATLRPGSSLEEANKKITGIIKKNCDGCLNEPFLYRFASLRLHGQFDGGVNTGGRIDYVWSLGLVALIILIIACINFMNLATARAATRSREVGVRKVIGAQRSGIILQFLGESMLLSVLALIIALLVVQVLLPFFNELSDKSFRLDFTNGVFVAGIIFITLLCGLMAGSYPSLFLSSFQPAAVLKGNPQSSFSGNGLRKILVVVQFTVSVVLIIGSVVAYRQIAYIRNIHLGFDKENVIVLSERHGVSKNQEGFKNDLLQYPEIRNISIAGHNPFNVQNNTTDPVWPGKPADTRISFKVITSDQNFIPALGMELLAGRNFSSLNKQDTANFIVNEKAMDVMGFTPENILGTSLEMWGAKGKIIGLVGNFNNGNLRTEIDPLIFVCNATNTWRIFVKFEGAPDVALKHIEATQKKYDPDYPFSYSFLNEDFNKEYRNEAIIGKLSLSFTVITIIISCLGLFGLASFTAERRTKEFGIRKAMGASVTSLVVLLCTDFARLIAVSLIVALPVAWYLSNQYLEVYVFHATLTSWIFVFTAVGTFLLAMGTVGYHSILAARANPVDSLRNE